MPSQLMAPLLPPLMAPARAATVTVIPLEGILDRFAAEASVSRVTGALPSGPVVVDLHGVSVCGVSGLKVLVECHRAALEARVALVFAAPSTEVRTALAGSGLGRHLPLCRSLSQALDAARQLTSVWAAVESREQLRVPSAAESAVPSAA